MRIKCIVCIGASMHKVAKSILYTSGASSASGGLCIVCIGASMHKVATSIYASGASSASDYVHQVHCVHCPGACINA